VVAEVGPGAVAPPVGARVALSMFPRRPDGPFRPEVADQLGGSLDRVLTEYAVVPADALVEVPARLTDAEAATLPCAGVTAWNALTGARPVRRGGGADPGRPDRWESYHSFRSPGRSR
jgi:NADPH:quinone reductase-like Zn-dependent oxidoreductase